MTTQRNASRHALELRSWITRVHETGAYRNRDDDFLEVLASWPITAEAASTLSHLLRSGLLTDTQYAQMTTQRALVRGRALPGYQGEYRRVRVLNGWLRHTHQPFQCGRQEGSCWIHSASDHPLLGWPVHWWDTTAEATRLCMHWATHPDQDDLAYRMRCGLVSEPHECESRCCE